MTLVKSFVMVRPSPVPAVALARAVRARSNGWKIRSRSLLMDADAGILDREFGDLVAVVDAEGDVAGVGELDGVRQQVDQDLPQPVLVGVDHGAAGASTGYSRNSMPLAVACRRNMSTI